MLGNEVMLSLALVIFVGLILYIKHIFTRQKFSPNRILTRNETEFFQRLRKAAPELYIFPQVAFRAIIRPTAPYPSRSHARQLAMIGSKHCDFLLCLSNLDIVGIIELDDSHHDKAQDAKRDALTSQVGYRTLRYESRQRPSVEELRQDILRLLEPQGTK